MFNSLLMKLFASLLLTLMLSVNNTHADNIPAETSQPSTTHVANTAVGQFPQDSSSNCKESSSWNDKMSQVLTALQNQIAIMNYAVAVFGVVLVIVQLFLVIAPYFHRSEMNQELAKIHDEYKEYQAKLQTAISEQSSHHEKRLYCVEDVIAEMWTKRSDKMDEEMATATDKQQVTEIFSRTLNAHSKDGMTLRKLLLDDPEQVFTALGDLESRVDELPKAQMLELLNLLELHGRLSSTQGTQGVAKRLRDKLNAIV